VGLGAGFSNTTSGGNTFVGEWAGYNTTGQGNTFIGTNFTGFGAGYLVTTGSRNTILGAYNGNQGGLDIRTSNNFIVLSDGDGNPRVFYSPAANALNLQTNSTAVARIQASDQIAVTNGSTVALTGAELGAAMVCVYDNASGNGAVFFANYVGATILVASDAAGSFATSDTAGRFCVYKNSGSHTLTFKNNIGSTAQMSFVLYASQASS
jgi:hypothetical protein